MRVVASLALLSVLSAGGAAIGQDAPKEVEWSALRWELRGAVQVEELLGRPAMRFGTGAAWLVDEPFENGTIEFDVAVAGRRSFVGVAFRRVDEGYEHVYLRPHQTGRFDALQYTPDWHGLSAWQLFPEFNTAVEIPRNEWVHVRLVVAGSKLQAFVGASDTPALEVDGLRRGTGAGRVVLTSFVPGATEDQLPNAFSNVAVGRSSRAVEWKPLGTPPADAGFVREWSVSSPLPGPERPIETLPAESFAGLRWTRIAADASGRVNLARLAGRPAGTPRGMVYARVRIRSAAETVRRLDFGFSDQASIFVNGRIVFAGNNTYRSRSLRYLGVMTIDNDAVWLPLQEGDNELVFAVIESFGGWGLTARFPDATGLTVR